MNPKGTLLYALLPADSILRQFLAALNRLTTTDCLMFVWLNRLADCAAPLISVYKAGEHLDSDRLKDLVVYQRAKEVRLETGKNGRLLWMVINLKLTAPQQSRWLKAVNLMVPFGANHNKLYLIAPAVICLLLFLVVFRSVSPSVEKNSSWEWNRIMLFNGCKFRLF